MPSTHRLESYAALSEVYQAAGFAAYSLNLAPRLLKMGFEMDWSGRSLIDVACGTGDLACWFAEHGFRVTGIDSSPAMLRPALARAAELQADIRFVPADMRSFKAESRVDLVTCLGRSLNYIATLRDLEIVFRQVQALLLPGKLFIFDLCTIQGLASYHKMDQVMYDNGESILIMARNTFSYETLLLNTQYNIFRCGDTAASENWLRADETHLLRGYPVQAVTNLLDKTGFKLLRTLTADMEPLEGQQDSNQLLFVVQREA